MTEGTEQGLVFRYRGDLGRLLFKTPAHGYLSTPVHQSTPPTCPSHSHQGPREGCSWPWVETLTPQVQSEGLELAL